MKRSSNSARCAAQTVVLCLAAGLVACGGGGSDVPAAPAVAQGAEGTAACGRSDNVKVGQVANLSTLAHRVSGKATVLDNCTIEITSFNYDGQGLPDVFVYGALAGNYAAGFAVGANLFGTPRANTTVRVTLKAGELNQLDGISIWCVRAGVSFGDGRFAKVT
jgi:hypothetical protein